ncbi:Mrp/NBP35 family ATP-binding protein [Sporobolomyces koalae]|uniref:Mrp/NBP35 family ATP-binding protein n=1 Tax=Sporobolomyces koalae TaxID=500713 RepID=UPI0031744ABA
MTTPFAPNSEATLLRRLSTIKHLLLVLSGKGGVGKSSVSVQLALSLLASDPTLKIGLLDVDLTGPSLPRMLGMDGREVLSSQDGWVPVYLDTAALASPESRTEQRQSQGVLACMSIGFMLKNSTESVVWRGPKKNAMIKQFLSQVRWGELDYLIVDTPPGTSDEHISLLETLRPLLVERTDPSQSLPTLSSLLVSTPQAVALLDVSKELSFVRRTKLPLLGLIENMSGYVCPHCGDIVGIFGQGGGEDFCRIENERKDSKVEGEGGGCRFLGRVPIDRDLVALLDDVAGHKVRVESTKVPDQSATDSGRTTTTATEEGEQQRDGKTLIERYQEIPSFKIVKGLAEQVKQLINDQAREEEQARQTMSAVRIPA